MATGNKTTSSSAKSTPDPKTTEAQQAADTHPEGTSSPAENTVDPQLPTEAAVKDLPPAPETGSPSTEDGPRTVFAGGDTAVIVDSPGPAYPEQGRARQECVVDTDTFGPHVGAAVPGTKVCSRHALHFDNEGRRRQPGQTQKQIDKANAQGEPV